MRRLAFLAIGAVLMFVAVLVVGELVVEPAVERRIAGEVQTRYGLADRPDVDIDAFPFLIDAVRGDFDGAEVRAVGAIVEGLQVEQAELDAHTIRFDLSDLVQGGGEVRAERVDARVEVTEVAMNQYLRDHEYAFVVTFTDDTLTVSGTTSVGGREVTGQASGTLAIAGSSLRFTATDVQVTGAPLDEASAAQLRERLSFEVPIPMVVGVRITGIGIGDGRAILLAEVSDYVLTA